jgi:hypothetical protein
MSPGQQRGKDGDRPGDLARQDEAGRHGIHLSAALAPEAAST